LFMILGALSWSIGVIFIRVAGTTYFVKGSFWLIGLYVLTIPMAWLAVTGIALAANLSGVKILTAVVIMTITATLLDGVAISWFPALYGVPTATHLLAVAWLLWFVGVSLWISVMPLLKSSSIA
jgi:hypothetical protein